MLYAHQQAQAEGREVLLVIAAVTVLRIFAVTGIDHLIPNFPSLEQALTQASAVSGSPSLPPAVPAGPGIS